MSDWLCLPWGSVCELRYGKALRGYKDDSGSTRIFGTNGPIGYSNVAPLATGPRPVVGRKGAYRGVHLAVGPFWVIDTAYWLEPRENLDPVFAYYALLGVDINGMDSGSALPSLTRDHFYGVPLMLPPLEEQERIACVLGAFDDLIETNRRLMVQIREVVRSAWVRAMSSEHVEMPFFDVFEVRLGAPFAGSEFAPRGVGRPLIRIRDLKTLAPDTWTTQSRPDETVIEPGDVLVGMDAEFIPTYWLGASGVLNQRVMRVKSTYGGAGLCCEALRDPMAFVQGYKTGTTVAHLNKADLQTLTVRIPDGHSRAVFNEATRGLTQAIVGLAQESEGLARQRDELLPLLMSGRVRVRELEAVA